MDKALFKKRFQQLVEDNPKTVRLMRSAEEVNSLDMKKMMAAGPRTFENYDRAMLVFIEECLSQGKEVAINAAGPQNLMITAAHDLFRKPGQRFEQDEVNAIMDGLEKLRERYHDDDGRELLTGGLDSWIYPEKYIALAQKYRFAKHKTFNSKDRTLVAEVESFLRRDKMVVVAAWDDRAEVYLEPEYPNITEQPTSKSGGCFIATAACGDRWAPEVIVLSAFRDACLARSRFGRAFILVYYAVSPPLAAVVARSKALRSIAVALLVRPAAKVASSLSVVKAKASGTVVYKLNRPLNDIESDPNHL